MEKEGRGKKVRMGKVERGSVIVTISAGREASRFIRSEYEDSDFWGNYWARGG
jgi:hypothetical protein